MLPRAVSCAGTCWHHSYTMDSSVLVNWADDWAKMRTVSTTLTLDVTVWTLAVAVLLFFRSSPVITVRGIITQGFDCLSLYWPNTLTYDDSLWFWQHRLYKGLVTKVGSCSMTGRFNQLPWNSITRFASSLLHIYIYITITHTYFLAVMFLTKICLWQHVCCLGHHFQTQWIRPLCLSSH